MIRKTTGMNKDGLQAIHCSSCRRVIAFGYLISGRIEIKCNACKNINKLSALSANTELHDSLSHEVVHAHSHTA